MNLLEARSIIRNYGYKLEEVAELPKPGDIFFSHREHDGIDIFRFYLVKEFKGQTAKLERIDHDGGGMWNPEAIPDLSGKRGETITKRFKDGSFALDKWTYLYKYDGKVKGETKDSSTPKESDEIEKAKKLLLGAGYKVLKEGRASPDYNRGLFIFGNGEGGFPEDSDLGRAYGLYEEGMSEDALVERLITETGLSDEDAYDIVTELFIQLDL
jgi:hypothetical protein